MYYLYRQLATRDILRGEASTLEDAKNHLLRDKHGYVEDYNGNIYKTIEELENAEDIRPKDTTRYDNFFSGGQEISEDTDRELSEADSDNTESSSERDN